MLLYLLKRNNVSAAMFAPGWVYETAQQPNFNSAQNKWWSLVEKSCGIVQTIHKSSLFTRISIRALVTMFHSKVSNSQIVAFSFILHRCPMVQHFCQSLQLIFLIWGSLSSHLISVFVICFTLASPRTQ